MRSLLNGVLLMLAYVVTNMLLIILFWILRTSLYVEDDYEAALTSQKLLLRSVMVQTTVGNIKEAPVGDTALLLDGLQAVTTFFCFSFTFFALARFF